MGIAGDSSDSGNPPTDSLVRNPRVSLSDCDRVLVLGRTGSGKTTLAKQLASGLGVPHVELDSLYFGPDFSTVPVDVLRQRVSEAIAADRWVTDGNKRAVRDIVWPRADTVVWLDYPLFISLWRLARRGRRTAARLRTEAVESGNVKGLPKQLLAAAKGVSAALRSHAGQRREYVELFAGHATRHLVVVRVRSPRATRKWLARVTT